MKHFVTCVIIFVNFMDELLKMFLLPDSAMSLVQWFFLFDKLSSMWLNVIVFWEICRKLRCDVSRCIIWLEDVNGQDATDTSVPFVEKLCTSFGRRNIITQSEAEELLVTWTVWHRGIRIRCLVHVFGWVGRHQNMGILNKHVTNYSKTHARQARKKTSQLPVFDFSQNRYERGNPYIQRFQGRIRFSDRFWILTFVTGGPLLVTTSYGWSYNL